MSYLFGNAEQLVNATRDIRSMHVSVNSRWKVTISSFFDSELPELRCDSKLCGLFKILSLRRLPWEK